MISRLVISREVCGPMFFCVIGRLMKVPLKLNFQLSSIIPYVSEMKVNLNGNISNPYSSSNTHTDRPIAFSIIFVNAYIFKDYVSHIRHIKYTYSYPYPSTFALARSSLIVMFMYICTHIKDGNVYNSTIAAVRSLNKNHDLNTKRYQLLISKFMNC